MVSRYLILSGIPMNQLILCKEIQNMVTFLVKNIQSPNSNSISGGDKKMFCILSCFLAVNDNNIYFLCHPSASCNIWTWKVRFSWLGYFRIRYEKSWTPWTIESRVPRILQSKVSILPQFFQISQKIISYIALVLL